MKKLLSLSGRRDRGATLVEYALLTALVGGLALGAIKIAGNTASSEVASNSACVSQRPQPASCRAQSTDPTSTTVAPVPTSSTTTTAPSAATTTTPPTTAPPATTTTTAAPPPPTTTTTTAPTTWGGTVNTFTVSQSNGNISVSVDLTAPKGTSDQNQVVSFSYTFSDGSKGTATCTTDSKGACTATFKTKSGTDRVDVTISTVDLATVTPAQTKSRKY